MAYTWDEEMMRLHHRIEELEKENAMLRGMLVDAVGIADMALTDGSEQKEKVVPEPPLFRLLKEPGA
jgi:hypothetical protein